MGPRWGHGKPDKRGKRVNIKVVERNWLDLLIVDYTHLREMKIKATIRYHFKPLEWLSSKREDSAGEDVKKRELLCTVSGNVNWYDHYGKQYGVSSGN